ncbi:chorismate mutase [Mangrovibacterium marinum]|uniref:chorismate mutase n=1 Tax=Mangrovibacterium marinum TaxID=1639118 RepID=A0A2T5BY28_9BACT|nr:chorismate mutase [Mangrovibacterium marinum]PTN06351.1 isochorismate pyruvate lyase [Mangrovibacterium marinum]
MKEAKSCTTIEEVRSAIDKIDREIMELLAKRQEYVHEIIRFKNDVEAIVAQDRQSQLYEQRQRWADELDLSPAMVDEVFRTMVRHNIQKEIELHKQAKIS